MIHEKALRCKDLGGLVKKASATEQDKSKPGAEATDSSSVGRVVSLMSSCVLLDRASLATELCHSDASTIAGVLTYLMLLLEIPLQFSLALVFLYAIMGPSVLVGLVVLAVTIPLVRHDLCASSMLTYFRCKPQQLAHSPQHPCLESMAPAKR